jgi:hypothetical protein
MLLHKQQTSLHSTLPHTAQWRQGVGPLTWSLLVPYTCLQILAAAIGDLLLVWAGAVQVANTLHQNLGYNDNLFYPLLVSELESCVQRCHVLQISRGAMQRRVEAEPHHPAVSTCHLSLLSLIPLLRSMDWS